MGSLRRRKLPSYLCRARRLGSRPPVRKTNELGFGARTADLKKGRIRPGRRQGSRPPVRKANELGFGARTAGRKKRRWRPGRRKGSRPPARKANELGFGARTAGRKKRRWRPGRRQGRRFFSHLYQLFCVQSGKISCCAGEAVGGNHPDEK